MAMGQKDRVPKKPNVGKMKNRPRPVVPRGFLFDPWPYSPSASQKDSERLKTIGSYEQAEWSGTETRRVGRKEKGLLVPKKMMEIDYIYCFSSPRKEWCYVVVVFFFLSLTNIIEPY